MANPLADTDICQSPKQNIIKVQIMLNTVDIFLYSNCTIIILKKTIVQIINGWTCMLVL